jgi:hypothetical protein
MPSGAPRVVSGSLFQRIQDAIQDLVRRGKVTLVMAQALLRGLSDGIRDVNDLTNLVFFTRHPERQGRKIIRGEPEFEQLSREWLDIRDTVVRPALQALSAGPAPVVPAATTSAPPPDRSDLTITGKICLSGRGKCWPWAGKSKDIVDPDVPWNDPPNRSPENYNAVLDYFNVGNSLGRKVEDHKRLENDRYRRIDLSTWCNIYVHDVTRAMWANIPHWVGRSELNANRTVRWLDSKKGRENGWIKIDEALKDWIRGMTDATVPPPFADSAVTQNLRRAAWQIAKSPATNQQLLTQASYVAQQFANQGLPTVVVWENFKTYVDQQGKTKRNSGHVAMIRPENSLKGKVNKGKFVPRSAQAGAQNWTNELATNMTMPSVMYFVHE